MAYRLSEFERFSSDVAYNEQPLFGQTLGDNFSLSQLGVIAFHWADFSETCELLESQMRCDETLSQDFHKMKERVNALSLVPIWVKGQGRIRQFNLHDLYANYIMNQNQEKLDPHTPMDISFISGSGPFKTLAISECFNHQTYRDMVMVMLLEQKIARRDFRVRVKAKVLVEYGASYEHGHLFQVEQLTNTGLLFSCSSDFYFREWPKIKNLRILMNTQMMSEASKMSLEQMRIYFDQFPFNLMYSSKKEDGIYASPESWSVASSFDFFQQKKVYLFLPFSKIEERHSISVDNLQMFMESAKGIVRKIAQKSKE